MCLMRCYGRRALICSCCAWLCSEESASEGAPRTPYLGFLIRSASFPGGLCGDLCGDGGYLVADSFQSDIFPPAPSSEASLSASEFFSGKQAALRLVSLEDGVSFASKAAPASTPAPAPAPTRTYTAPTPEPAPAPVPKAEPMYARQSSTDSFASPPPPKAEPAFVRQSSVDSFSAPAPTPAPAAARANDGETARLEESNARLTAELRDAREKIRNLELQLEGVRANARKAAQALLDG
ncbi:hypothetical protein B0H17DRAFT_461416 [Mycena rosella]|uniref:Uncharacterized protein n=1 Tax=Mycena rosella TaxID=1033263 RepID=A0AAD7GK35_MYCRO|nr:hypothetical protein B0H17DRAFT_461416 [Mycena rosella]